MTSPDPSLSVVIPVFNEEGSLPTLIERLTATLEGTQESWEVLFINDGSRDRSLQILEQAIAKDNRLVVIDLVRNSGQHAAVLAGMSQARGEIVITLDADLQNPPEEIPKLLAATSQGHDVVGTVRQGRKDSALRRWASGLVNWWTRKATGAQLTDYGCMLRAYRKSVVRAMVDQSEQSTFLPVLAERFSRSTIEIPVAHEERKHGESKYGLLKLLWLQFDLTTSFTLLPLRITLIAGIILSAVSFFVGALLVLGRIFMGVEWAVGGVFTVLAFIVMLIGSVLFSLGLVGEYIGRIYLEVRGRPTYLIREILRGSASAEPVQGEIGSVGATSKAGFRHDTAPSVSTGPSASTVSPVNTVHSVNR